MGVHINLTYRLNVGATSVHDVTLCSLFVHCDAMRRVCFRGEIWFRNHPKIEGKKRYRIVETAEM